LLEGKSFDPILTFDHWWNVDVHFDESLLRRQADAAAEIGQEYFLLDRSSKKLRRVFYWFREG
jgi:hypothetical protein